MKKTTLCYIEQNNKYLMLYRNKKSNDINKDKWIGIGGKFMENETPKECLLREVYEETGLNLTNYIFRGIIKFVLDGHDEEYMYLYTASEFSGELKDCDEGELSWVKKEDVYNLPIWEGDKAIFKALETVEDFFYMKVIYKGDKLINTPKCEPSPLDKLYELQDIEYAKFQAKLTPTIDADTIIGVRIPILRKFAKQYIKTKESEAFLDNPSHIFYDERMLHGILISEIKDYKTCIKRLDDFLPFVDNWGVCDIMSPKSFKKNKSEALNKIIEWSKSEHTYTCRFGLEMLMSLFLDEDFKSEYLEIPASVKSEEYYVNMMIAWFFATALAKQWDATIPYISEHRLPQWVHNKTIQKSRESFRITKEQKELLKSLKLK